MKWLLIISLFYLPAAYCQSFWQVKKHNASVTTEFSGKAFKYAVLNVNWDSTIGCRPTIGLVFMKGNVLGTFKAASEASEFMIVSIGNERWSEKTIIASYTGGVEAMFVMPETLVQAFKNSGPIHVKLFQNSPIYEFPLEGAATAIVKAKNNCK